MLINDLPKSSATVVVLGDAMLDLYVTGDVERISPEAPVPVVRYQSIRPVAGGAGNVAVNMAALDVPVHLVSVLGDDSEGDQLQALLRAAGVQFHAVTVRGRATTSKTRVMGGSQHLLRMDREDTSKISSEAETLILERLDGALQSAKVLAISDYAKGVITDRVLVEAIALARARNISVLVDPKRRDFSLYAGVQLIKPNRLELATATGMMCHSDEEVGVAAEVLVKQTGATLMVTRSEKGMSFFAPGAAPIHMATEAKAVFDVSGAGDTVFAAIAYGVANGISMQQTMRLANIAAGIVVSKPGTATVSLNELRVATAANGADWHQRKGPVVTADVAVTIREHWRQQGLTVGFTNGCFDILHPGHIAILRGAASYCDRLIVGLNADASVTRLKGPTRPVQTEASRASVVGAIDCVDLVVVFDEDTPFQLIQALLPDVLVKGADYDESQIVGADIVRAAGGRVERVELVPGQSTTKLIRKAVLPSSDTEPVSSAHVSVD